MKTRLLALALLAGLCLTAGPTALAATVARQGAGRHHRHTVYVVASSLNVRGGPSFSDAVVTVLLHGARATAVGWVTGWTKVVTHGGVSGWVVRTGLSRSLTLTVDTATRQAKHGGDGVSAAARKAAWAHAKSIFVSSLAVRSAPSSTAPVIGHLVRGNRVGIMTHRGAWDKILRANGQVGWAPARYIGPQGNRSRGPAASGSYNTRILPGVKVRARPNKHARIVATTNGSRVRALVWRARWVKVELQDGVIGWAFRGYVGNGRLGQHAGSSTRHSAFTGGHAVAPRVRIRSGPSFSATVIGLTRPNLRVRILGYSKKFVHVELPSGSTGWIVARFVKGAKKGTSVQHINIGSGAHITVTTQMRASPDANGRAIATVHKGAHVVILEKKGSWDLVRISTGKTGYISSSDVAK